MPNFWVKVQYFQSADFQHRAIIIICDFQRQFFCFLIQGINKEWLFSTQLNCWRLYCYIFIVCYFYYYYYYYFYCEPLLYSFYKSRFNRLNSRHSNYSPIFDENHFFCQALRRATWESNLEFIEKHNQVKDQNQFDLNICHPLPF